MVHQRPINLRLAQGLELLVQPPQVETEIAPLRAGELLGQGKLGANEGLEADDDAQQDDGQVGDRSRQPSPGVGWRAAGGQSGQQDSQSDQQHDEQDKTQRTSHRSTSFNGIDRNPVFKRIRVSLPAGDGYFQDDFINAERTSPASTTIEPSALSGVSRIMT